MVLIVLAMFVILFVAAAVAGVVVLGIEGRGRSRAPQLADHCATAAHHLNGEAQPPVRLGEVVHRYVSTALEQRSHAR